MLQILSSMSGQTPPTSGSYRVDTSRGECVERVSSEWFSRAADERFLSLPDLHRSVKARAAFSRARVLESREVRVLMSCPTQDIPGGCSWPPLWRARAAPTTPWPVTAVREVLPSMLSVPIHRAGDLGS